MAASVTPSGSAGPAVQVSGPGDQADASQPAAAAVSGGVLIAWVRAEDGHLLVRRLSGAGELGSVWDASGQTLNTGSGQPSLTASSGRAAVAWRNPASSAVLYRSFSSVAGPLPSDPVLEAAPDGPDNALYGTNVQASINASGAGVVTWHRGTDCHILGRRISAGGALGDIQDISGQDDNAIGDTSPGVLLDDDGYATFFWHRDSDDQAVRRIQSPGGSLAGFMQVSSGEDLPSLASFGLARDTWAWQRSADGHVLARAGAGADPQDISQAAASGAPAAAAGLSGLAAVAWRTPAGAVSVAFSQGPAAPDPGPETGPGGGGTTSPPANRAPVAGADRASVLSGGALRGASVLANDSDPDGDALSAAATVSPRHGTVALASDGTFTYRPARGFAGTDSFTYAAKDASLQASAEVTVTVRPACTVPALRRLTLTRARAALARGGCRLGAVTRVSGAGVARGQVLRASRAPGERLERGARISLALRA